MAVQEYLPGGPSKRLIKLVRSRLRIFGIRPRGKQWYAAWSWANAIANSYFYPRWPSTTEIATQYLVLLLVEMKEGGDLRLPYRASKVIPDEVKALLSSNPVPLLIHEPVFDEDETKNAD